MSIWEAQAGGSGVPGSVPQTNAGDGLDSLQNHSNTMRFLQDTAFFVSVPYGQPAAIVQGPVKPQSTASFVSKQGQGYLDEMLPLTLNTTVQYSAPSAPIRRDNYWQEYQRTSGQWASGTAPTDRIYTGVEEL